MKKFAKVLLLTGVVMSVFIAIVALIVHYNRSKITDEMKEQLGIKCVKTLYEFSSGTELDQNMSVLKELCTDAVYSDLTIDNEERTLTTYLKFENKPVKVNIVRSTADYVYYSLDTDAIDADRLFIFNFNVNKYGQIDWIKECECIEFLDTIG